MLTLVLVVVLAALVFEFINGFHDTANSIAASVATKVLTPGQAVSLAAVTNLLGALTGTAVAATIATGIVNTEVPESASVTSTSRVQARSTGGPPSLTTISGSIRASDPLTTYRASLTGSPSARFRSCERIEPP